MKQAALRTGSSLLAGFILAVAALAPAARAATLEENLWSPNGQVRDTFVAGDILYIGGDFRSLTSPGSASPAVTRNFLAAIDLTTGEPTAWNPGANGSITAMASDGATLYVVGGFNRIAGQPREYAAAFDLATGQLTGWSPPGPNFPPHYAVAVDGSSVYVGGRFTSIGGKQRFHLAAFSKSTGRLSGWNPSADLPIYVLTFANGRLYAGGQINSVGGQARFGVAAFENGRLLAWNPGVDVSTRRATVRAIAVAGNRVYLGGEFSTAGGEPRPGLAAVDASTGQVLPWNPAGAGQTYALVHDIAVNNGVVYAGGEIYWIDGVQRSGLAALDQATGVVLGWTADVERDYGFVDALSVVPARNRLYVGGSYSSIDGRAHANLAGVGL